MQSDLSSDVLPTLLGSGQGSCFRMPQSSWCVLGGRWDTTDLDSQSVRVGGLIRFACLTSQTIKIHPARLMVGLIMGIWHELFFHMVSSYGTRQWRDKGPIKCHDRLFQKSVFPPIKNLYFQFEFVWVQLPEGGSSYAFVCLIKECSRILCFLSLEMLIYLSSWLSTFLW